MGFMEDLEDDIDEVFFDEDFFGSRHNFDGEDIVVILDEDEKQRNNGISRMIKKDESNKDLVLLFVRESDMKRKITINSSVTFDDKVLFVQSLSKSNGVWKMLLGRSQV